MNTTTLRTQVQIAPMTLLVLTLGIVNWIVMPERAVHWAIGIGTMLAIWFVVTWLGGLAELRDDESERHLLSLAAIGAGAMLTASLAVALYRHQEHGPAETALLERAPGVVTGLLLAAMGNLVPKVIKPLAARRCGPGESQSLRRFTGWAFALAGVGYTIAWVALAPRVAETVAPVNCATALVLVVLRIVQSSMFRRRS